MAEYIERESFLRWVGEFRPGDPRACFGGVQLSHC